jgi:hypothetical protein
MLLVYATTRATSDGWGAPVTLALFGGAAALVLAFLLKEKPLRTESFVQASAAELGTEVGPAIGAEASQEIADEEARPVEAGAEPASSRRT